MTKKEQKRFFDIFLFYVLLQPFLDIISFLSIREIIPFNICTYLKPLFVFSFGLYLLLFKSTYKKNWIKYIVVFLIFLLGHFSVLLQLLTPISIIIHEFRFVVNIAYMVSLFIILFTIYHHYEDKKEFFIKLKKTILYTFLIYFILLIISVLTGTSALTYEYADKSKKGFKGWFDSGQILGHAFSISLPILMYMILSPKNKWYIRTIILSILIVGVSLLGTKVPYYITLIVLILYFIISIVIKLFNKKHESNYFNIFIILLFIIGMFFTYKYTPVNFNTELNKSVSKVSVEEYDLKNESGYDEAVDIDELKKLYPKKNINKLVEYHKWNKQSSEYLDKLFTEGKIHPSNMRYKQVAYSYKKYFLATMEYKLFGIGFLNQNSTLALESDFFMALFSFGILGFLLFFTIPIYFFVKSTIFIFKNLKLVDLEFYLLYMGLGAFFCISAYAGYTYIYTNFSIFLVILIVMLNLKLNYLIELKNKRKREIKEIDFLVLHLGYGGIESATINTANALIDKYKINIVSFYKLDKNQQNKIDKRINVRYLYDGSPNRDEFKDNFNSFNVLGIIKEGLKAVSILIKKKTYIIRYIRKSNADAIVSTRVDFNLLLSKFGKSNITKIAQEHHYHNNNKKYINKLKKYNNIDYLFALTKTLEKDYKKFLENNYHTKVILVPNMLTDISNKKSNLNNLNLITISRLDYGKRNDEIINIFSKINNKKAKLFIVGDGKEYNNLKRLIDDLNLNERVILTGYKNKKEIEKYLLDSCLFLMASVSEGLPMVLLEAMSYGVPCLAYETDSGVNDIIKNKKNGFVIKNRNEEEYINIINDLLNNEKLLKELGKNAKYTAYEFSKDEVLKIWYSILR